MKKYFALSLVAGIASSASAAPTQWRVEDGGNGHVYEVVALDQHISWQDADTAAMNAGGYLATLTSAAENQFVFDLSMAMPGAWYNHTDEPGVWNYGPWLGATRDPLGSSSWKWITGEDWAFTAWGALQPDSTEQNWLAFGVGVNRDPQPIWADTFDYEPVRSYVVEYSVPSPGTCIIPLAWLANFLRRKR